MRPVILGAIAALSLGFVLDVGPWTLVSGPLLGPADAQEAAPPAPAAPSAPPLALQLPPGAGLAEPSEADRAALRYFAREGDVERLEAELRRLRSLYPGWQPPSDLLDPGAEDAELQRVYNLVGRQEYAAARQALAERQQRDPSFVPPDRLVTLLDLADARLRLREASEVDNFRRVLAIGRENEAILTCEDPDSLWRVAEAFARTERPQRAYDAYAYVITNCTDQAVRASTLQKAAGEVDVAPLTQLFALGDTGGEGADAFEAARLDIIRAAVARAGEAGGEGSAIPPEWLDLLAEFARTGVNLEDAMLIGYYLYRQGSPVEAAQWFRFALDAGLGADAAEGYIVALRATGDREDAALAREVAYQWREETPELMEAYLDAVSTILTADARGQTSLADVEQPIVDRFVPVVIAQRDPNGAQALGWYAFNTCQFIIAEEWFISSANWVPTEAAVYGLALTRLRLGDEEGFRDVVGEWGPLYASVASLASGGEALDPADPVTGGRDDPTDEVGVDSVICDPEERERLRQLIVDDQDRANDGPLTFTEAGSLTAAGRAGDDRTDAGTLRAIARGSAVISPRPPRPEGLRTVQAPVPTPNAEPTPGADDRSESAVRRRALERDPRFRDTRDRTTVRRSRLRRSEAQPDRAGTVVRGTDRTAPSDPSTVERRVRGDAGVDAEVRRIVSRPRGSPRSPGAPGGTAAQRALTANAFSRCVALTDRGIADGTLTATDASARGFCLLQLRRPVEAAQAFQLARARSRADTSAAADAVYGATLSLIAADLTAEAGVAATAVPLSRPRRTELQIALLTQRAIAANRDGRSIEALHHLDQRNRIAPLQKDLMLLQGFAYRDAGDLRSAARLFRALDRAGSTAETRRALAVLANQGNDDRLVVLPR
ncbi:hypothetical protein [Acuticoccus sp.]|uniref:hypothetical protein n=1 Tax=Acuticoccus sp. TaxID=1904378 RepID=UPI003B522036